MNRHDISATVRFGPSPERARGAIILLHGRGSSGRQIARLADSLTAAGVAFLAPSALHGTWYPHRFLAPLADNEPFLSDALALIEHLVGETLAAGIPTERIGLAGFSQGACLALEYALRHPRRYGFVAGLSGALIGPPDTPRPAVNLFQTPVLLACSADDDHIPADYVDRSAETFAWSGASVTRHILPGSAHTVFPEEIAWINDRLATWQD
ncbi:phospholipase [Opitutaceae bacterium TAV5]|nr:phospholipase [Opitutaceae bacterium TAV5]